MLDYLAGNDLNKVGRPERARTALSLCYLTEESHKAMDFVRASHQQAMLVTFTMDAGPNVKSPLPRKDLDHGALFDARYQDHRI